MFRDHRRGETQVDKMIRVNKASKRSVVFEMPGYGENSMSGTSPMVVDLLKAVKISDYPKAYKATYDVMVKYNILHEDWHGSYGIYHIEAVKWHSWYVLVEEDFGGSLKACKKARNLHGEWDPLDRDDDPFNDKEKMNTLVKRLRGYGIVVPDLNEEVVLTW